ncbi:MAG: T9SS type A sorting domain-containing protein [Flavobacteriales bacterium]|nr:T9SS type A sorting domain-containing protein [Flavobacteriales bacterium]MCB9193675.1 T9SS type A sorting domain-containing protein [Flavobacteriales bacterium]
MYADRYASLILAFLVMEGTAAQTTTLSMDNVAGIGRVDDVLTTAGYTPPPAGGLGVTIDYSAMSSTSMKSYQWLDPAGLPNAALFPNAELALTDGGTDTAYYAVTMDGLARVGEHQVLLGLYPVDAPYSDGALELKLPLAYGDTWLDNIAATFDVGGGNADRVGVITGEADALGWIILPGTSDPIEVLRVRTHVIETITTSVTTVTHHRHVDAYYATFSKYPVFRSYADSLTSPLGIDQYTSGTEWLASSSLGIAAVAAVDDGMRVSPVPADDLAELIWNSDGTAARCEVFDATGSLVLTRDLGRPRSGAQRTRIDVSAWEPGLYLVRLRTGVRSQAERLLVR